MAEADAAADDEAAAVAVAAAAAVAAAVVAAEGGGGADSHVSLGDAAVAGDGTVRWFGAGGALPAAAAAVGGSDRGEPRAAAEAAS